MSNFIVKPESIAKISNFIAAVNYSMWSMNLPEETRKAFIHMCTDMDGYLDEKKLCKALAYENFLAVESRYKETADPDELLKYQDECIKALDTNYVYAPEWDSRRILKPEHIQLYKTIQCFLYQIDSDGTYQDAIYKGIDALEKRYAKWIVANMAEYNVANWE